MTSDAQRPVDLERIVPADPVLEPTVVDAPYRATVSVRVPDLRESRLHVLFDAVFSHLVPLLADRGVTPVGPPFALYRRKPERTVDIEVGFPVDCILEGEIDIDDEFTARSGELPSGRVGVVSRFGAYADLDEDWEGFVDALEERGERPGRPSWEVYVDQPRGDMDDDEIARLRTDLFVVLGDC